MRQKRNRMRSPQRRDGRDGMGKFKKLQTWDTWIGTLLQQMCSRFCSRTDTTDPPREEITTPVGLQTCNKSTIENEEESYYSQSDSAEIGSDSAAECPTPCPSYCSNKVARRNPTTHRESELPDGVRPPTSGELASFRLRRPWIKPNA